jgi:ABC-type transport system substrate-binding protein
VLHSTQGAVGPLAGSAAVDALIERARSSADAGERAGLFREIESCCAADAVIVPLFHEQECRLARPEVRGFELRQADPVVPYEKLWIER